MAFVVFPFVNRTRPLSTIPHFSNTHSLRAGYQRPPFLTAAVHGVSSDSPAVPPLSPSSLPSVSPPSSPISHARIRGAPPPPSRTFFDNLTATFEFLTADAFAIRFANLERFGAVHIGSFAGHRTYFVMGRHLAREVLGDEKAFLNRTVFPGFSDLLGSDIIIFADGEAHRSARARITPTMASGLFDAYCAPMWSRVDRFWKELADEFAEAEIRSEGVSVKLIPRLQAMVADSVFEMTAGITEGTDELGADFQALMAGMLAPRLPGPWGPWANAKRAKESLMMRIRSVVEDCLRERADVIDCLREVGIEGSAKKGTRKELKSGEVDLFTFTVATSTLETGGRGGGQAHDIEMERCIREIQILWFASMSTTSAAMASAVFELARNPEILERLRKEQDGKDLSMKTLLREMPDMEGFLLEVLRLRPPFPGVMRCVRGEGANLAGFDFEPEALVLVDLVVANRCPVLFPSPDTIDLDRYSANDVGKQKAMQARAAMFAFGEGLHRCVGEGLAKVMIKITLATLIRSYNFGLEENVDEKWTAKPTAQPSSLVPLSSFVLRK